jgi:ribosomal protein S12
LKCTEAFGCEIDEWRLDELNRLASQVKEQVSSLASTDSAQGVVLEDNDLVNRMANMADDDVARARSILNSKEIKSDVPGITSSLFNKLDQYGGKHPVLQEMLKSIH